MSTVDALTAPRAAGAATISPPGRLAGEPELPGDKSISHRALMLAMLATGESRIRGASDGDDVASTAGIARSLGATVDAVRGEGSSVAYRVASPGFDGLRAPRRALDCGNSGTSMRLFAGILAGLPGDGVLDGDASLRSRPMARVIEPLRAMGAEIGGVEAPDRAPLRIRGRRPLRAVDWTTPVSSAQVKSAILLAGLRAAGTVRIRESVATRDHTERMLRARGVHVRTRSDPRGGSIVELDGGGTVRAIDETVPGDPSAAAFWLVAGAIHPDAMLRLRRVDVNPTRRAAVDLLRSMGAAIEEVPVAGIAGDGRLGAGGSLGSSDRLGAGGEPIADLAVRSSDLRAIELGAAETAAAIDEIPVLCLAATQARGRTVIRGAGELRHKESDRIAGIVDGLSALGARISATGDDIVIDGPMGLRGTIVDSRADHRLALTFAIAGLVAEGATTVLGADSVSISYPMFFADLERIRS